MEPGRGRIHLELDNALEKLGRWSMMGLEMIRSHVDSRIEAARNLLPNGPWSLKTRHLWLAKPTQIKHSRPSGVVRDLPSGSMTKNKRRPLLPATSLARPIRKSQ